MNIKEILDQKKLFNDRINAGVKWLDLNKPDWLKKMKIEKLDLGSSDVCVLGQVFRKFWDDSSVKAVSGGLSYKESVRLGFALPEGSKFDKMYDPLTMLWYEKLKRLKKQRGL